MEEKKESENYELIRLPRTKATCQLCEDYAKKQAQKTIAVLSCEGACMRGEVARQAANLVCHRLAPDKTVRICLGGAFTKDGGQRALVRTAPRVLALEGCFLNCASRTMQGVLPELRSEIIAVDELYDCPEDIFGINDIEATALANHAQTAARRIVEKLTTD